MKAIYIAGPFRGRNAFEVHTNINMAESTMYEIAKLGVCAVCPHTMTRNFDQTLSDTYWLESAMELLNRSDAIFMLPTWRSSKGAIAELAFAKSKNMPVFYSMEELEDWLASLPLDPLAPHSLF